AYTSYMYAWEQYRGLILPFRRGGLLMIIFGALGLLMGGCFGVVAGLVRLEQIPPEMAQVVQEIESKGQLSFKVLLAVWSVMVSVLSVLLVVLGLFVRKGSRGAVVAGMVLVGLILLFLVWNLLGSLAMAGGGGAQAFGGVCMAVVMLAMFGLLMGWLVQAARAVPMLRGAAAQYQNQYWQYMQGQQQYGQGYGGVPVPPALPAQQPPGPPDQQNP
ncbi:MAG: hypothetical protein NTU53_07690, partial [Planctomycetota bacterium]|nr:hypothetical protein [Planctomycetota bacterium]